MELSLPDMPFGMGGRRARAAAHPGESRRQRRRRKLAPDQRVPGPSPAGSAIEGAASAQRNARKADQSGGAHGAEIDQVAGSLSLREREPFMVCATPVTLAALAESAMFGVLAPDVVKRIAIIPGVPLTLPGEVQAQVFMVPGKLPLYLEGENPEIASETAANVGVEISAHNARMVYILGAAAVTAAMTQRIKGASFSTARSFATTR
jgi:Beta-lactamase superfamily domain